MFEQIFLSPQVKRSVIISNKQGIRELINTRANHYLPRSHVAYWFKACPKQHIFAANRSSKGTYSISPETYERLISIFILGCGIGFNPSHSRAIA